MAVSGRYQAALLLVLIQLWSALCEELPLVQQQNGSRVGFKNGTLYPFQNATVTVPGTACGSDCILTVEAWTVAARQVQHPNFNNYSSPFLYIYKSEWNGPLDLADAARAGNSSSYRNIVIPYMKHQRYFGSNTSALKDNWHVFVFNDNVVAGARTIDYQLRVTCSLQPQCPSPTWYSPDSQAPPCSGFGNCSVVNAASPTGARCSCDDTHAGAGCYWNTTLLDPVQSVVYNPYEFPVTAGQTAYWKFRSEYERSNVVVTMERNAGDLMLLLKSNEEGTLSEEVPLTTAAGTYADIDSWRSKTDFHSLTRYNTTAREFYVGVRNFLYNIWEPARFNLTVVTTPVDQNNCPWNCFGGRCDANGVCECKKIGITNFRRIGPRCEGVHMNDLASGAIESDIIFSGWQHFYNFKNKNTSHDMTVEFVTTADPRQVRLVAAWNRLPTPADYDFSFSPETDKTVEQTLLARELRDGELWFGIYNIDLYIRSQFDYNLTVTHNNGGLSPYALLMVAIFVALGGFTIIIFSFFALLRYKPHWLRALPYLSPARRNTVSLSTYTDSGTRRVPSRFERRRPRGPDSMHPSVMSQIHEEVFSEIDISADGPGLCPTCLEEFEVGQRIQRLPCNHIFHARYECLERWLTVEVNECPVCRRKVGHTREQHQQEQRERRRQERRRARDIEMAEQLPQESHQARQEAGEGAERPQETESAAAVGDSSASGQTEESPPVGQVVVDVAESPQDTEPAAPVGDAPATARNKDRYRNR